MPTPTQTLTLEQSREARSWCDATFAAIEGRIDESNLSASPRRDQVLYVLYYFTGEVLNGGVEQFYTNNSGHLAGEARVMLKEVGAPLSSLVLGVINRLFYPNGRIPRDQEAREAKLERMSLFRFLPIALLGQWLSNLIQGRECIHVLLYEHYQRS
jgi:hypothetical protein